MASLRDPVAILELDIRDDLERVEAVLHETITSDQTMVHEAARYLIDAGCQPPPDSRQHAGGGADRR